MQLAQNCCEYLGYFCKELCSQELSKSAQSGHTEPDQRCGWHRRQKMTEFWYLQKLTPKMVIWGKQITANHLLWDNFVLVHATGLSASSAILWTSLDIRIFDLDSAPTNSLSFDVVGRLYQDVATRVKINNNFGSEKFATNYRKTSVSPELRFGGIRDLFSIISVYLVIGKILHLLWQFLCDWANFHFCKLPNIQEIMCPFGHISSKCD